jgi:glyceraldehyde 3-phosphate dehydrogenase
MISKKIRVFINGFGRIGRSAARIMLQDEKYELVGINDLYSYEQMAYLLKYDSTYGTLPYDIKIEKDYLLIDEHKVKLFSEPEPKKLDIVLLNVDVLLQCSGVFLTVESNIPFVNNGAKKVIVSAPPSDAMPTYIYGVNHQEYRGEPIISNSSCSANAIVPILKIIEKHFGLEAAMMSMYHSYTLYQNLLDGKHYSKDIRRTRSATQNIIPLMSGAAKATAYFFPYLKEKFSAKSIRIPIPATTLYDLSIRLKKETTKEEVNKAFKKEIEYHYQALLSYSETLQASDEYIKDSHSAVLNLPLTSIVGGNLLRISAWQDNEYGYAKRLVDMIMVVEKSING